MLIENEDLVVSDEEIDSKINEIISQSKENENKITSFYRQSKNRQHLYNDMINEKLFERLSKFVKVKVVEESTNELRKKQAA